jgi:hypothetical protein
MMCNTWKKEKEKEKKKKREKEEEGRKDGWRCERIGGLRFHFLQERRFRGDLDW